MLNELCEVGVNLQNVSDENLVNFLFCYSLGDWSLLKASIRTGIWHIQNISADLLFSVGVISFICYIVIIRNYVNAFLVLVFLSFEKTSTKNSII